MEDSKSYDGRMARLETMVESLAGNLSTLSSDVATLASYTRSLGRTNWSTIFAGVTLVVALVAGYVALPMSGLKENFLNYVTAHRDWAEENLTQLSGEVMLLREWKNEVGDDYHRTVRQMMSESGRIDERVAAVENRVEVLERKRSAD